MSNCLLRTAAIFNGLAAELDIAYNPARARLDEIVALLGGAPEQEPRLNRRQILDRLAAREISVEEALRLLKGTEHEQRK